MDHAPIAQALLGAGYDRERFAALTAPAAALLDGADRLSAALLEDRGMRRTTVFSPIGFAVAAALAAATARGETRKDLLDALGLPGDFDAPAAAIEILAAVADASEMRLRWREGEDRVKAAANGLSLGCAVVIDHRLAVEDKFRSTAASLGAASLGVNFSEPGAERIVNDWVSAATKGKITDLFPFLDANLRAMLLSAVHFADTWAVEFPAAATQPAAFALGGGGTASVPMMRRRLQATYGVRDGYQMLVLPLEHTIGEVVLVLPPAPGAPPSSDEAMGLRNGVLVMPRLDISSEIDLQEGMEKLGHGALFAPGADLSGLSPDSSLFFGKAAQRAVLKADEKGVEGAALTYFALCGCGMPPQIPEEPFAMVLDRPFLLVVRCHPGLTVFHGVVADPGTRAGGASLAQGAMLSNTADNTDSERPSGRMNAA